MLAHIFFSGITSNSSLLLRFWRFLLLSVKVVLLFHGNMGLDMMFFLYTRSHTERLLYYMHPLFRMCALSILVPLVSLFVWFFSLVVGLRRGAERRTEGWSGLQRAGLAGPDHLPGNITRYFRKIDYVVWYLKLLCSYFFPLSLAKLFSLSLRQGRNWLVKRSYEDFRVLDKHLHLCIYDRRYSQLTELPRYETLKDTVEVPQSYSSIISNL